MIPSYNNQRPETREHPAFLNPVIYVHTDEVLVAVPIPTGMKRHAELQFRSITVFDDA